MTDPTDFDGDALPDLRTEIPGPRSRDFARRLAAVESPNITSTIPVPPIVWAAARGANVRDVDGNVFIDLTSGFGVAFAGHGNARVADAIAAQAHRLPHALGDVQPADMKVALLERIAQIMPSPLRVSILGNSGSDSVEAALKTAVMRTGRSGVLAFQNAYHGLSYGTLAITDRAYFRRPFEQQLNPHVRFAPFPEDEAMLAATCKAIDAQIEAGERSKAPIGAIIVEPIQGRGGIVVPPRSFVAKLRDRCDGKNRLLIFDEVYTGCGRTGHWLACEHDAVIPDLAVIGKGLSGALPVSACIGSEDVMSAWPASHGEAIHTSTFLGNPIACAAALAQLGEIESHGLLERARLLGARIQEWAHDRGITARGRGLLQGLLMSSSEQARAVCVAALQAGLILLTEGPRANVIALTPSALITDRQFSFALDRISAILSRVSP